MALRRSSNEQGFAIPIAMGLGLIMLLVGATMIIRAQGDQVTASAQKGTARSLAIAEGGLSRTLDHLNKTTPNNSWLLKLTYDPDGLLGSAQNEWIPSNLPPCLTPGSVISGTIGDSTYKLLAYRYDSLTKRGTFLVEGLIANGARSRVQQTFNVEGREGTLAGVFAVNDVGMGNTNVLGTNGNVICTNKTNCPVNTTTCPPPRANLENAIGTAGSSIIQGNILLTGPIKIPNVPVAPLEWNGTGTVPITEFTIPLPNYTVNNTVLEFPRFQDIANHIPGTPYHYSINTMNANGFDITIYTQISLKNPTGDPVYFYVSGNINMGGNSKLKHDSALTKPTAFRLYGTATTTQNILVGSGATDMDVFIFAPKANVGINGTGNINGFVWGNSFGVVIGSTGNAVVNVPISSNVVDELGDLAIYLKYRTGSSVSWQRKAVP